MIARNITRNQWHSIALRTIADHTKGVLYVTLNGNTVLNYSVPLGYYDQTKAGYWKFGICRAADTSTATILFRNMNILKR
ncbi:MAG: hypothetical protein AAF228_05890 [Pseudomonadota bacterium]